MPSIPVPLSFNSFNACFISSSPMLMSAFSLFNARISVGVRRGSSRLSLSRFSAGVYFQPFSRSFWMK